MSNPTGQTVDTQGKQGSNRPSFADLVNKAVNEATVDDKGNLTLPDGLSEEVQYAATLEKRRRDTQASYTKTSQENKALKAEKSVLMQKAASNVTIELTAEQAEELEDLKFSDPEVWRKKMNSYEKAARERYDAELESEVKKVSSSTLEQEEIERRASVLKEFCETNKGFSLDDDVIANDIPPRIVKKLETGNITFEDFLKECYDYLNTGKVIKQEELQSNPNLGKVGGGSKPDKYAVNNDVIASYKTETY